MSEMEQPQLPPPQQQKEPKYSRIANDSLECLSCNREFSSEREPLQFPCFHTVCSGCITGLIEQSSGERKRTIMCPFDGKEAEIPEEGIQGFTPNYALLNILATRSNSTHQKICEMCEDQHPATHYCLNDAQFMCDSMKKAHLLGRASKHHRVQPLTMDEAKTPTNHTVLSIPHCSRHNFELNWYCEDDRTLMCDRCCHHKSHKNHTYGEIEEVYPEKLKEIESLVKRAGNIAKVFRNTMAEVEEMQSSVQQNEKDISKQIDSHFNELYAALERRKVELLTKVTTTARHKMDVLGSQLKKLDSNCASLLSGADQVTTMIKKENKPRCLLMMSQLEKVVTAVEDGKISVEPETRADIEFKCSKMLAAEVSKEAEVLFGKDKKIYRVLSKRSFKSPNKSPAKTPISREEKKNPGAPVVPTNGATKRGEMKFCFKFGNEGSGDAEFNCPWGVGVHEASGHTYVADYGNHRVQVFDKSGMFLSKFGTGGSGRGQFKCPTAISVNQKKHHILVADTFNHRVVILNKDGSEIAIIGNGSAGQEDGQLNSPYGVAVIESSGRIVVSDSGNYRIQVFDDTGKFLFKFGKKGSGAGEFAYPRGLAVDQYDGTIYVADEYNHRISLWNTNGEFVRSFGVGGSMPGQLQNPIDVALDSHTDTIVVADYSNHRIQIFDRNGVFIMSFGAIGQGNGQFSYPLGVRVDHQTGNLITSEYGNHRVSVFATPSSY